MLSLLTKRRRRISAIISMNNTPDSPAQMPDDRTDQGGNYWTLFTPGIWKDLHAVLQPLPPYSPELNRMENVWEYLRANKLSAGVWDDYDEILQASAEAWNWLADDPDRIRSIGAAEWTTVSV